MSRHDTGQGAAPAYILGNGRYAVLLTRAGRRTASRASLQPFHPSLESGESRIEHAFQLIEAIVDRLLHELELPGNTCAQVIHLAPEVLRLKIESPIDRFESPIDRFESPIDSIEADLECLQELLVSLVRVLLHQLELLRNTSLQFIETSGGFAVHATKITSGRGPSIAAWDTTGDATSRRRA
jgi:hypothetical protein